MVSEKRYVFSGCDLHRKYFALIIAVGNCSNHLHVLNNPSTLSCAEVGFFVFCLKIFCYCRYGFGT